MKKYTRFECNFRSFPLVWSVFLDFYTRLECNFTSSPLVSSVKFFTLFYLRCLFWSISALQKLAHHLRRTTINYTRNEWRRCKTTLETSGEVWKLHSKRVEKIWKLHSKPVWKFENHARNDWRRSKTTLETSGEDVNLHSKRVERTTVSSTNDGELLPSNISILSVNLILPASARTENTLETGGEDVKITLETSGEDVKLHSKWVEKID